MNRHSVVRAIGLMVTLLTLAGCAMTPSKPVPLEDLKEWDVLILGDSSLWDVGPRYAALIEQQQGVKVNLHDMWQPALRAYEVRQALQGEETPNAALEDLRDVIRDAEVVVIFANPLDEDYRFPGDWNCVSSPYRAEECSAEALAGYEADMSAIWAEVGAIREGAPVVARAVDIYNPLLGEWAKEGIAAECTVCWENMSQAAARAAAAHGVPFVSIYDAFNGPEHDEDAAMKGYFKDGEHPSEQGAAFYARTLAESGFAAAAVK